MPKERLDSWKAIAEYLERSMRTVQRWHAHHGLPVHRFGGVKGAVFAYPEEIDRWLVSLAQETRERAVSEEQSLETSKTVAADLARAAKQMWEGRSERNVQTIAALYRKALDHDPSNTEALAGLANSMIFAALFGILDGAVAYPSAQDAVRRIEQTTIDQAECRCAVAWLNLLYEHDRNRARAGFEAALAAEQECSFAWTGLTLLLLAEGELTAACAAAWKAWRIRPSVSSLNTLLCWVHAVAGETQQALELVDQVKLGGSAYSSAATVEAYALLCAPEPELCLARIEELAGQHRENLLLQGMLGYLYASSGQVTSALEILYSFDRMSRMKKRSNGYPLALLHLGLGNLEAAQEWLEAAYAEGAPWSLFYRCDPLLARLKGETGFERLIARASMLD
jgi:tetratricopeptide (TPR) repeat protein